MIYAPVFDFWDFKFMQTVLTTEPQSFFGDRRYRLRRIWRQKNKRNFRFI